MNFRSNASSSISFKRFGNITSNQFPNKQFQDNKSGFPKSNAFNNPQNLVNEKEELGQIFKAGSSAFTQNMNQDKIRNPREFQSNYEEKQQNLHKSFSPFNRAAATNFANANTNDKNRTKFQANDQPRGKFPNNKNSPFSKPNAFRSSSNNGIEEEQQSNNYGNSSNMQKANNFRSSQSAFQQGNFQRMNQNSNNDFHAKNAKSFNNRLSNPTGLNQRKTQEKQAFNLGMELEENQIKSQKNDEKNQNRQNFGEDQPKFDKNRLVKRNFLRNEERPPSYDDDINQNEPETQNKGRSRSRNTFKKNYPKNTEDFEHEEEEKFVENPEEDSKPNGTFRKPPKKLVLRKQIPQMPPMQKLPNEDEKFHDMKNQSRGPNSRQQKPFERIIKSLITQPRDRRNIERNDRAVNFTDKFQKQNDEENEEEQDYNEEYNEEFEEPKPIKKTNLNRIQLGEKKKIEENRNTNEESERELKERLKKKNFISKNGIIQKKPFDPTNGVLQKKPAENHYFSGDGPIQKKNESNYFPQMAIKGLKGKWKMCNESEGQLRQLSRQLDIFERDPEYLIDGEWVNDLPIAKPEWCIKKYSRSDAGKEYEEPFSLEVLENTLDYIIDNIIDVDNQKNAPYLKKVGSDIHTFFDIYCFVYDRFRAINKDLTILMEDTKKETIEMLEKMVRFFILSINEGSDFAEFEMFRNIERITDFLTTLMNSYKKSREKLQNFTMTRDFLDNENEQIQNENFFVSPNEAEFFAYTIIFTFDKPLEMEKNLGVLGKSEFDDVRNSPEIAFALKAISSIRELNVVEYFRCMKNANYLEACSIYYYINNIRKGCLDQISRMINRNEFNAISLSYLLNLLYFNSSEELLKYLEAYGLNISYLAAEDSFEDETQIQSSFIKDWTIYDDARNNSVLISFKQKNKKIDEKKGINNYSNISKNNDNYYNNEDVSRKFLLNGVWKKNDQIFFKKPTIEKKPTMEKKPSFEKKLTSEKKSTTEKESAHLFLNYEKTTSPYNQSQFPQMNGSVIPLKKNDSFISNKSIGSFNSLAKNQIIVPPIKSQDFSLNPQKEKKDSKVLIVKDQKPQKKNNKEILNKKIKERERKIKKKCWVNLINFKKNRKLKKESEKHEIGKLFSYDFRSDLQQPKFWKPRDDVKESYQNFLSSLKSEKYPDNFISDLAYSLLSYSQEDQNKIFFKVCIFLNNSTNFSQELSSVCQNTFCPKQKKSLTRRFKFQIDEANTKEISYCARILQPLSEIPLNESKQKTIKTLKKNLRGSDLIIFIISEDFREDSVYYQIFKKYVSSCDLEKSNILFLKADKFIDEEKKQFKQKFDLQQKKDDNLKKFKILACESPQEDKSFLNKISVHLKNMFQNKIHNQKFMTLNFGEIFTNIYHILKTNSDENQINVSLKTNDFKSYFYNKNLMNICLGKFYNSFAESIKEIPAMPFEVIQESEKKKLLGIEMQKDILLHMTEKCFLDDLDKKYRRMIKSNLCKFFDYKIVEEIVLKYLKGFFLFDDEEISNSINKYFAPLYETFDYNEKYGIGGYWNEFFLALLKCLYCLFKKHKLYITIQNNFDFEINPSDFIESTEKEIENHVEWIKRMKSTSELQENLFKASQDLGYLGKRKIIDHFDGFGKEKKICLENAYKKNEKEHIFIF